MKESIFENFTLLDARKNPTHINGKVITSSFVNPEFDLQIESDRFRLLNSEKGDNPLYYGTAVVDLDLNVQGNLDLPVVDAKIKLREETNVTYVVPASQAQIESRQGIVRFPQSKRYTGCILRKKRKLPEKLQATM
ncbi:MAG: translocation/assembly module TamB domain-containing protein [Owenweeksia sp.]|nr:translocation/assembly module TamB domain-containing protein [Owenweeksia sp.]